MARTVYSFFKEAGSCALAKDERGTGEEQAKEGEAVRWREDERYFVASRSDKIDLFWQRQSNRIRSAAVAKKEMKVSRSILCCVALSERSFEARRSPLLMTFSLRESIETEGGGAAAAAVFAGRLC
jgi:hypothetical protein